MRKIAESILVYLSKILERLMGYSVYSKRIGRVSVHKTELYDVLQILNVLNAAKAQVLCLGKHHDALVGLGALYES